MKTRVAIYEEGLFDLRGAKLFKGTALGEFCCVALSFCCVVLSCLVFLSISWSDYSHVKSLCPLYVWKL